MVDKRGVAVSCVAASCVSAGCVAASWVAVGCVATIDMLIGPLINMSIAATHPTATGWRHRNPLQRSPRQRNSLLRLSCLPCLLDQIRWVILLVLLVFIRATTFRTWHSLVGRLLKGSNFCKISSFKSVSSSRLGRLAKPSFSCK